MAGDDDAINEDEICVCSACCCEYTGCLSGCDMIGCSGRAGILCLSCECCCKAGAPCLCPLGCCGCKCVDGDSMACIHSQYQCCCCVDTCAFPCNDDVPCMVAVLGLTCCPVCGCCKTVGAIKQEKMQRD
mmetsp:Transcript_102985/g.143446  ORF Transcript_102985/g.143446 Transcript_102985/m.143446 type:complete len:130 (-) Transcript_102985:383-772(-)